MAKPKKLVVNHTRPAFTNRPFVTRTETEDAIHERVEDGPHRIIARYYFDAEGRQVVERYPVAGDDGLVDPVPMHLPQTLKGENSANSANTSRLFPAGVPENTDLVDLVVRMDAERGKPKKDRRSMNEIAREFTGETPEADSKAQSLLTQIRKMKREGRVNL